MAKKEETECNDAVTQDEKTTDIGNNKSFWPKNSNFFVIGLEYFLSKEQYCMDLIQSYQMQFIFYSIFVL